MIDYQCGAPNKTLTAQEEIDLAERIAEGDETALGELITRNLRLVPKVAHGLIGRGLDLEEMIAEGMTGLVRAARGFDPSKGKRFVAYAGWWIRRSIDQAIRRNELIHVPANAHKLYCAALKMRRQMIADLGQIPTHEEIARALGLSRTQTQTLALTALAKRTRVESGLQEDGELEQIPDPGTLAPDSGLDETPAPEIIAEFWAEDLTPVQARLVALRYGLDGNAPHSRRAIARKLGCSRESARVVEWRAMRRLRIAAGLEAPLKKGGRRRKSG